MVDKLNSDQTQVDLNEARNKVNEIIDEVDSITIKSYDAGSLPLVADNGSTVLVTDGTEDNTQCMAYYFQNKWYRHFDNTAIELELWTPAEIATELWLDASDSGSITHSSSTVSQWNDKSGKNNHVVANGDPSTGSSTQNLLNVIDFDGNDYFIKQNFANPSSGDVVLFIVCEVTGVDSVFDSIIAQDSNNNDWQLGANNSTKFYGLLKNTNLGTTSAGNTEITGFNIFCVSFDKTEDQKIELLVNGSLLSGTTSISYTNNVASTAHLAIFANRALNHSPSGKVAEVIIYESPSNSQRQQVEGYLAHKWGITGNLNGSHPYKTNVPKVASGPG
jgi:hypothetical protein